MTHSETLAPGETTAASARFARMLPLAFITYSLAYLDRVNIGFGEAGSMSKSLNLTDDQFTFFNASFFIGYVLFQIPGARYAAQRSVKKLMFWALIFWGIIASSTAFLHIYKLLLLDRFLLGAVEGLVFPSLLVFLTHWFTKRERSRANTLLILGNPLTIAWASVGSSFLVQYFSEHPLLGLHGWQWMLLAEGAPTLLWALIWWMLADDRPTDARWLSADQAASVQSVLDSEQAEVKKVKDYWAAFRDPQVILLCLLFFAWSVGIYGLNMWLPVIMKHGSTFGIAKIGLLSSIPYLISAAVMVGISSISDRLLVRQPFVWPFMFLGAAAFLMSFLVGRGSNPHFWISFTGLIIAAICMYAPYGPFWAMVPEMVSRNVIGESLALINTIGAVGGFVGTYGVGYLKNHTGGYGMSFASLSAALVMAGVLTTIVRRRPAR
jgi:sugar phosphate permease